MRVPLSWLKDFVDITLPVDQLAELLTLSGLEVAEVEKIGVEGAELPWDADKIVIGNILEVKQHPNADRLVLAEVDYGAAEPHTVVTGAPNLFPYRGQGRLSHPLKSIYAKEGATLYDGHAVGKVKAVLKGKPVRGVMSDAMLCSEKELGLSEEHEGILILPDDAPVGLPLRDYLGDAVLDIDILPNMARALSILGVAREVAALTGAQLRMPEMRLDATGPSITGRAQVTVETPELCPRFTATLVEGVTIGASPLWMQRRLVLAGMRPIFNIVDISNYVMLELGQPTHTFDADKVADQHLIVRLARDGERLTTLDGKQHALGMGSGGRGTEAEPDSSITLNSQSPTANSQPALLVADPAGPSSIAGVMGGAASEVGETTSRVLLEAAIWEPTIIRRMARAFKLPSEASRRFERGVDYELPPLAQRRALGLMQQIAGGTVAQGMIDVYARPWQTVVLDLPPSEITRILGITLTTDEIAALLRPLGFVCEVDADRNVVRVTAPSFRQDVTMLADLCEEVARMYGYDRIPTTMLADELPEQRSNPSLELEEQVRDILVGAGLDEAITYSLTNMGSIAKTNPLDAEPARYLKLSNPITPEREYLRLSILPTLLEALATNLREYERVLLFELGHVYLPKEGQVLPDQPRRLAIAMAGTRAPRSWLNSSSETIDFFDLKGMVEALLERLHLADQVRFVPLTDDARFHPGRAARLVRSLELGAKAQKAPNSQLPTANSQSLGVIGELHPAARARLELDAPRALAAELDLEQLIALAQPPTYRPISRFPAISQDLALIVGLDTTTDQIVTAIRKYAGPTLESLALFDVYEGPQVGVGKRSLAYRLTFRAQDRTLSDADVSKVRAKIVRGLEHDIGATLRG